MVTVCAMCHIDRPGGHGAHSQSKRLEAIDYLIEYYGLTWYEEREPWASILRRG